MLRLLSERNRNSCRIVDDMTVSVTDNNTGNRSTLSLN